MSKKSLKKSEGGAGKGGTSESQTIAENCAPITSLKLKVVNQIVTTVKFDYVRNHTLPIE
jgi:hypothetical protein